MVFLENLLAALSELWVNKFRSILTTLGIIIATASVICVVSLLDGMTKYMESFIQGMGSDAIWISPDLASKADVGKVKLTEDDAKAIAKECKRTVRRVAPMLQRQVSLRYRVKQVVVPLTGTTPEYSKIRNWYVDEGRYFTDRDSVYRRYVCVLGRSLRTGLDVKESLLGKKVRIGPHVFTVVGLLEKKGNMFGQDQDKMILIPLSTAKKLYGERAADQILILAQAVSSKMADLAVEDIERVLRRRHGIAAGKKNDFAVHTQDQALDFFNKSSRVATFVLAGIVSISLLVGGIGIMNIMLVSVTERTREIGVLKALGARDKDILVQFLTEAIVLSGVGGMLGIVLGAAGSLAISYFSPLPPATVPAWSIALGFAFSAAVGVFFGMYPAVKAARLHPIDALRYE